jgi:putative endonuclease
MVMFYIYILYSESHDKYYVGYTDNIERRLSEHNTNPRNTFTHKYRPWEVAALFQVSESRAEAMKIEKFIKQQKSRKFIFKLIETDHFDGKLAQLVRVPKLRD